LAAVSSLMASTSRGSLLGLGLGLAYLLVSRNRQSIKRARRHVGLVLLLVLIASGGVYATQSLWLNRLNVHGGTTGFDRPATWISGLRVAADHPLTGVGPDNLATLIQDNPRYNTTPYGNTTSFPHDIWIFALAAGGIPYALAVIWLTLVFLRVLHKSSSRGPSQGAAPLQAALVASLPVFVINNIFSHPEVMVLVVLATALLVAPQGTRARSSTGHSKKELSHESVRLLAAPAAI
jgi:O-antigen ligase